MNHSSITAHKKGSIKNEIEVVAPHVGTNQSQNKYHIHMQQLPMPLKFLKYFNPRRNYRWSRL